MENLKILVGGKIIDVPEAVRRDFADGDLIVGVAETGDILHIPKNERALAESAVGKSLQAFSEMREVSEAQLGDFYKIFAGKLADDVVWGRIFEANCDDVERARAKGRSVTRLELNEKYRKAMIEGLRFYERGEAVRGKVRRIIKHKGWEVEEVVDGLGVVAFVFEGRPNVLADAVGVLKSGNTCVLRIGSDALGTAGAMMREALLPALRESGLPMAAVQLLESRSHAAAWALFADGRISLAVARGSGTTAILLGAIARQHGNQVSLHGTGGAWIIGAADADSNRFEKAIYHSLDRKVCNTVNTICLVRDRAQELMASVISALEARGKELGHHYKIHVTKAARDFLDQELFEKKVGVMRDMAAGQAEGEVREVMAEEIGDSELGIEWEWDNTPEVTIAVIDDIDEAVKLFNSQSPRFVAALISDDHHAHERFFRMIDSPFVCDGMTRWVDGQLIYEAPELGLSNFEFGRLLGRGGVLTGADIFTVRLRVKQSDVDFGR